MFNDNKYHDRYYPNLLDNIPNDERKNHFFLPTILINKNLKEKIRIAEKTENQFLFIFDILKLKDYLYALSSPLRIKKINLNNIMFFGSCRILRIEESLKGKYFFGSERLFARGRN